MEINKYIDHTILKATTKVEDIKKLCAEAKEYGFYSVCVNGCYVELAKKELDGSDVKVAAVVGFPLGGMSKAAKVFEAKSCLDDGAYEIDMVMNIGFFKSGNYDKVEEEIKEVKRIIGDKVLKVIIETCYLTDEEKELACNICIRAGADFVKTSTGFGIGGATLQDIELMKRAIGSKAKVKASGGIKDYKTAKKYIEMGAERLGTSSGVELVKGEKVEDGGD
jgi:deoxyribose-phosphate aldolase